MKLPVRQMLYEKRTRILFTVQDGSDDDPQGLVQIHRVLRVSQDRLQDPSQLLGDQDD